MGLTSSRPYVAGSYPPAVVAASYPVSALQAQQQQQLSYPMMRPAMQQQPYPMQMQMQQRPPAAYGMPGGMPPGYDQTYDASGFQQFGGKSEKKGSRQQPAKAKARASPAKAKSKASPAKKRAQKSTK